MIFNINRKLNNMNTGMESFYHTRIGKINIAYSQRAIRVSIRVKSDCSVRLTIPRGTSKTEALKFLEEKQEWILRAQERVRKRNPIQIINVPYNTRSHTLQLNPERTDKITVSITFHTIDISYPVEMSIDNASLQKAIRTGIEEAWRIEAKSYLPLRTVELCNILGFKCGKVTVRNARTRWGSCSPNNNISLSIHLMKLPDKLIDYVIIHELCHTIHKNHGHKFHRLLTEKTAGAHPILRKELRKYSTCY